MKVKMIPDISDFESYESGIKRVCQAYNRYGFEHGIEYVRKESTKWDLTAVHAGMMSNFDNAHPLVSHTHGLYWTADYDADKWEFKANANVIASVQHADVVTVPSSWVAETFQRDMHIDPVVVPHGIEWDEWQIPQENEGYVVWNKNRSMDVCNPEDVKQLAIANPAIEFYTTFAPQKSPSNVFEIGILPHGQMKQVVANSAVYLSTTKETFGIGILEALACGIPVLGYAHGGNLIAVKHLVNGYLAKPGNIHELSYGLEYCLKYRKVLSDNARESAREWTWSKAMKKVAEAYQLAIDRFNDRKRPHFIDKSLYMASEDVPG